MKTPPIRKPYKGIRKKNWEDSNGFQAVGGKRGLKSHILV
jgi:hypothetical protein